MYRKIYLLALLMLCICHFTVVAQDQEEDSTSGKRKEATFSLIFGKYPTKHKGVYHTWGGDGALLSFGSMKYGGDHLRNIPRFTMFVNVGTNFNYDFSPHFGIFSGINIKNIGLISKGDDDVKLKRRVYTAGVPLGFKIGDVSHGDFFFFFGGSYDLAFNYKEKQFVNGEKKHKFNEWFSDRTSLLMPSVFAGVRFAPGFGLKVQYYPNDFFNKDYKENVNGVPTKIYQDLSAKMFFVTLNYDFHGGPNLKRYKYEVRMKKNKSH